MSKKIFFGMIVIFLAGSVYYGLKSPNTDDAGLWLLIPFLPTIIPVLRMKEIK